jgi:sugar phosphate isomerase/epimerase
VADQVLLSASRSNLASCVDLALEYGLGIEVMTFAFPNVLDGDWKTVLHEYRDALTNLTGPITLHGPFMDMVSGSPDERINAVCRDRYIHAMQITAELGANLMVVHANFIGSLHNEHYRRGWHVRNIDFWAPLAEKARAYGVIVALENMWEYDPTIIAELLEAVDHPNLQTCLDIGHAHIFGDTKYTLQDWVRTMQPWLVHSHMNNNNGKLDEHHGFNYPKGVINYREVLKMIRSLPEPPQIVLEMDDLDDMRDSLSYFVFTDSAQEPA